MNRLGIMCDASHISVDSFMDLVTISKAPIIASHSGCYALNHHKRNLTDRQLRALKKNGGVVQIVACDNFIESTKHFEAIKAITDKLGLPEGVRLRWLGDEKKKIFKKEIEIFKVKKSEIEKRIPDASLTDFVNHIQHAVKIAGIDHVGIGTDFDGGGGVPGLQNHGDMLNVTVELVRRGFTEEDIIKIWGGNLLRVWKEVEALAEKSR